MMPWNVAPRPRWWNRRHFKRLAEQQRIEAHNALLADLDRIDAALCVLGYDVQTSTAGNVLHALRDLCCARDQNAHLERQLARARGRHS